MSDCRISWHKRYHGDALASYMDLTLEQRGAFTTLLDSMYDRKGPLVNNERLIAGMMGISVRKYKTILADLMKMGKIFITDEGMIYNKRASKEVENMLKTSRKNSENQLKSVDKRAENKKKYNEINGNGVATAIAHGVAIPEARSHIPDKKKKNVIKKACKIPEYWKPSDDLITSIADKHKVSEKAVSDEVYNFVNHWTGTGKPMKDWAAVYRTWCAKPYCPIHGGNKPNGAGKKEPVDYKQFMRTAHE